MFFMNIKNLKGYLYLGAIVYKGYHRNDAATIREKQAPSSDAAEMAVT